MTVKLNELYVALSNNEYYSDEFVKGFECGARRQCAADRKEIDGNTAEWEQLEQIEAYDIAGAKTWAVKRMCNNCGLIHAFIEDHTTQYKFCPQCGSRMIVKVVESHAD